MSKYAAHNTEVMLAGTAHLQAQIASLLAGALLLERQWPRPYPVILRPMVAQVLPLPQVRLYVAALVTCRVLAVERPCGQLGACGRRPCCRGTICIAPCASPPARREQHHRTAVTTISVPKELTALAYDVCCPRHVHGSACMMPRMVAAAHFARARRWPRSRARKSDSLTTGILRKTALWWLLAWTAVDSIRAQRAERLKGPGRPLPRR